MFNKKIRSLLVADVTWFFGEGLLGPLFAIFAERIGGDVLEITWAWATYLIVMGILMVFIGRLSDKYVDRRKLLFAGYVLNAIFTFSYLLVSNPFQLLLVQAGLGVAAAFATPTWNAVYSENENKKIGGLEWGMADGLSAFFSGIAIILGGLIVTYISFSALFIIMGIIQTISAITLIPAIRKK